MDFFNTQFILESIIKMGIAAFLSIIIGVERELKRKPVGLKTSLVIGTFSCLLTLISIESVHEATAVPGINVTMDPLRLAAQIVSGIGFLGAGVILRKEDTISGLTTAALIWGAAALGIAVGAGFYVPATIAVLITLFGIKIIAPLFTHFGPERLRRQEVHVAIRIEDELNIEKVVKYLRENNFIIESITIRDLNETEAKANLHELKVNFSSLPTDDTLSLYTKIKSLPYVKDLDVSILK